MFSSQDPRPLYNPKVLRENFEREKKHFRTHETFNPSFKTAAVTGKFYSQYDCLDLSTADSALLARINQLREGVPRQIYPEPITGNQVYGWNDKLLVPLNKGDTRYYAPRTATVSKVNIRQKKC